MSSATMKRVMKRFKSMHRGLIVLTLLLSFFGLLMQYSAAGGDFSVFARPQMIRLFMGLVLMVALAVLPPAILYRGAYVVYGLCVGRLVMVELVGIMGLGAQR